VGPMVVLIAEFYAELLDVEFPIGCWLWF